MLASRLHRFLTAPTPKVYGYRVMFWLSLSLTFAAIYSYLGLRQVFSSEYVIHDDVRSHVFWMRRFLEPDLFPQDLIADYFQSVAPSGYAGLYRLVATLGIDPVFFNKLLPLILALTTIAYCFGVVMLIFPVPAAGFIATLFLNQTLWDTPEVTSGTPRAFFIHCFWPLYITCCGVPYSLVWEFSFYRVYFIRTVFLSQQGF